MPTNTRLFTEFPAITKQQWLAEIEKDLKGKAYSTLQYQTPEGITIEPFYHADDRPAQRSAIIAAQSNNDWEIGEDIVVITAKQANQQLLAALSGGVNAPRLIFGKSPTMVSLQIILKAVDLPYISLHLAGKVAPEKVLLYLHLIAQERKNDPSTLKGSIQSSTKLNLDQIVAAIEFTENTLSNFKVVTIHGDNLNEITKYGAALVEKLIGANVKIAHVQAYTQFSLTLGTSYFYEIARLRALKIVWANVLAAYSCTDSLTTTIHAHLRPDSQVTDPNTNMIRATTQALSAAIGGVASLTLLPSDAVNGIDTDFSRRIARNVQHLMKMESYLDKVIDPAAGSYYVESLTDALAEKAWANLIA
jgi:methylmalonyl-CoA mutase